MIKQLLAMSLALVVSSFAQAQRTERDLRVWDFSRDGHSWQTVRVPHDWAIGGPFDKKWDLQKVAIKENGETKATEKSGRSGSLPWIGEGMYRTRLVFSADQLKARRHVLVFDGAMAEPRVYVNGTFAGEWKYGYNCFRVDITPFLKAGENLVEVKLRNMEESSRWYPGAGLYRPVKLQSTVPTRIDDWSTFVRTDMLRNDSAYLSVEANLLAADGLEDNLSMEVELMDAAGMHVAAARNDLAADGGFRSHLQVAKPRLWTPETPYLYKVAFRLFQDNRMIDEQVVKTGIRTVSVSKENGFQLNGKTRKIQGVCLHHDLGPLGAAVNRAALIRQLRILKEMGADAIRTAHNMPSQMQMELCDSMGVMVMAESFDMWRYPKCKNGYARFFDDWAEKDIERLVRANRNHPSIVMWSIGNEIPEQWSQEGRDIARRLQDVCHRFDPTRPVTQGMDKAEAALKSGFAQVMDVPGFNYRVQKYPKNMEQLPQGFLLGSETASTVSSRGVYKFPAGISNKNVYPDGQCSSYDTEYCSWSNLPESDFAAMDDLPYTIGQFVWTGFDYLGEPTPYDEYWPSRSSYFGICDLAGLPKDRYYLYRSQWNKQAHTVHLLPHWTWPGREGKTTPVFCYTDYPSAELFVNGVSQGRISKKGAGASSLLPDKPDLGRYRLMWNDVKYQPGELRVVVFDEQGNQSGEQTVRTAGKPSRLQLEADRTTLHADGDDMAFVTVRIIDENGVLCPDAADELEFEVEGSGTYEAACNGDATSLESFTAPRMRLFHGCLVAIVRASDVPGNLKLHVKCPKWKIAAEMTVVVR